MGRPAASNARYATAAAGEPDARHEAGAAGDLAGVVLGEHVVREEVAAIERDAEAAQLLDLALDGRGLLGDPRQAGEVREAHVDGALERLRVLRRPGLEHEPLGLDAVRG